MKKFRRIAALGLSAAMMASVLAGCGTNNKNQETSPATETTQESAGQESSNTQNTETTGETSGTASANGGKVYYLNFKPEQAGSGRNLRLLIRMRQG